MSGSPKVQGRFIQTGQGKLFVHERNPAAEKTLVLLHGWLDSGARWTSLMSRAELEYHVFAPDLPGFGRSAYSVKESISLAEVVEAVSELLGSIHRAKPIHAIIGHSMGGTIALECLKSDPHLTENVFLCDVPVTQNTALFLVSTFRTPLRLGIALTHHLPKRLAQPLIKIGSLSAVLSYTLVDDIMIADAMAANPKIAASLLEDLSRVRLLAVIPPLKITHGVVSRGARDRLVGEKESRWLCDTLGGRYMEFGGASHTPQLEVPGAFNQAVLDFLQSPADFGRGY